MPKFKIEEEAIQDAFPNTHRSSSVSVLRVYSCAIMAVSFGSTSSFSLLYAWLALGSVFSLGIDHIW